MVANDSSKEAGATFGRFIERRKRQDRRSNFDPERVLFQDCGTESVVEERRHCPDRRVNDILVEWVEEIESHPLVGSCSA